MNVWADIMAGFAILVFVAILGAGVALWRPRLAQTVKIAEQEQAIIEHIVEVRHLHPEIVRVVRIDRHPWYLGPHLCIVGYCLSVFLGARLTSNVLALGDQARYTMATCFFVGSVLVLIGSLLGSQIGKWTISPKVRQHATASVLGDDIVLPYRVAMAGLSAMLVSSGIYAWTSFQSTAGSLGGWLTGGIAVLAVLSLVVLQQAVKKFIREDTVLITEAKARLYALPD